MAIRTSTFSKNLLASASFIFCAFSCFSYEAIGGGGLALNLEERSSISRQLTNANNAKESEESSTAEALGLKPGKEETEVDDAKGTLSVLADEINSHIISFLPLIEKGKLRRVSTYFRKIADDQIARHTPRLYRAVPL